MKFSLILPLLLIPSMVFGLDKSFERKLFESYYKLESEYHVRGFFDNEIRKKFTLEDFQFPKRDLITKKVPITPERKQAKEYKEYAGIYLFRGYDKNISFNSLNYISTSWGEYIVPRNYLIFDYLPVFFDSAKLAFGSFDPGADIDFREFEHQKDFFTSVKKSHIRVSSPEKPKFDFYKEEFQKRQNLIKSSNNIINIHHKEIINLRYFEMSFLYAFMRINDDLLSPFIGKKGIDIQESWMHLGKTTHINKISEIVNSDDPVLRTFFVQMQELGGGDSPENQKVYINQFLNDDPKEITKKYGRVVSLDLVFENYFYISLILGREDKRWIIKKLQYFFQDGI